MLKYITLAIVLLAVTQAVQTDQAFQSILSQLNENPFGKALGSLVQMHMQSESEGPSGRLQEISKLLHDIQAMLEDQQQTAKTQIENKRSYCQSQQSNLNDQLTQIDAKVDDSNDELDDLKEEKSQKSKELIAENANKENTTADLDTARKDQENEDTSFVEHKRSFEEAIIACEEAIRLLGDLVGTKKQGNAVMFVQLSQKFTSVKDLLEKHVKKGPNAFIQPIIDVLMELGSEGKIDFQKVSQIITLIQTLLSRLREGLHDREIAHKKSTEDLATLVTHLQDAIFQAGKNIRIYEERLKEIDARVAQLSNLTENLVSVLGSTKSALQVVKDDCKHSENAYVEAESRRSSEVAFLQKLIDYFENKVTGAVSNVRD